MALEIVTSILNTLAGIGIFLTACTLMSSSLKALGSERLKRLLLRTDKSKLAGVGAGAAATALIQSSSAATVMIIGFVDAGVMTLNQAASAIYGANIGTTITALLAALGVTGSSLSVSVVLSAFACIGAFMTAFAHNERIKLFGGMLSGFGMLFVGLNMISGATSFFSELTSFRTFIGLYRNPLLLIFVGMLLTAVIQSSSVMTSVAVASVVSGLISLDQAVYLTMGTNIGTCITALLACIAGSVNAKRTALIHLIFNVSGVVLFLFIAVILKFSGAGFSTVLGHLAPDAPHIGLAVFHIAFNVAAAVVMLPLTSLLIKLVKALIPDRPRRKASAPKTLQKIASKNDCR